MSWIESLDRERYREWLESRPRVVREVLAEFPFGTKVCVKGEDWVVFGANEGGSLIVIPADSLDYDEAMDVRRYLCPDHLRRGEVFVMEMKE